MGSVSVGARLLASEAYQRAVKDGDFARGKLPDDVMSVPLLDEAEVRSALRLRTYSDLAPFDIEGVPYPAFVPVAALLPSRAEAIPATKLQVLLGAEASEQILAGSVNDGQPLPEATVNFGALNESPVKLPRFGSATPVSLGVLDEPGVMASLLQRRFECGVQLGLENEMLNDSAGGFWTGVLNLPTNATGDATHAATLAKGGNYRADAICNAIAVVQANGWYVRQLQVISHPTTRAATYTERDSSQRPLAVSEMLDDQVDQWIVSRNMPVGTAIVADVFGAEAIIQRGGLTMELAPNHQDFLTRGLVDMKLETRLLVWQREPSAICIVTGL